MMNLCRTTLIGLFFSLMAQAAGTFELEGKVKSFTPEVIQINDGHHVYAIVRKKLSADYSAILKTLKSGQSIKLHVPFDAVESAKLEK